MTTITAQVEAIIDEIAPACVDCSEHVVANRLSAMRRLAERLYPIIEAAEARAREEGAKAMQFQPSVDAWMDACFGEPIKSDQLERCDRFIEEALELAQTCNAFTIDRAHALVDYVFNRDQGEINQEVGGVMVTLAALCNTAGVDMLAAADTELARVWTKVEQIRAKQAAKPTGSALPIATLDPAQIAGGKP